MREWREVINMKVVGQPVKKVSSNFQLKIPSRLLWGSSGQNVDGENYNCRNGETLKVGEEDEEEAHKSLQWCLGVVGDCWASPL